MLFQPSNIAPSTLSGIGIGTVDVTKGIDVSWQVNGDSPMTAYQITIYQNDSSSTQMFTTGEITLGTPFQPHDAQGNPMFFSTNINAASLASAGIVNGYANGYKLIIKQWWSANDYVEQTSASVFITRTTPTITIDAIPNPVASSNITITSTYSQAEGDPISTVEWTLALFGHEDNPIKQTGSISTQVLSFDADGLITGYTYSIMCSIVTSNGMEATTGFVQFSVSYQSSTLSMAYELAQMRRSSAVYLSWDNSGFRNILPYPYTDSTKTTNGITFTVNGEGDISAVGTASADAYFTIAEGTSASLGIVAGEKLIISSGRAGVKICVTETNSSNVVVSTVIGSDPLQYVLTNTQNKLTISIVILSGTSFNTSVTLSPVICEESKIVAFTDVIADIMPVQNLNGYSKPWIGTEYDQQPYNFRSVSSSSISPLGNSEMGNIVGGTVGWNQLVKKHSEGWDYFFSYSGAISYDGDTVINTSASANQIDIKTPAQITFVSGHKYFVSYDVKCSEANGIKTYFKYSLLDTTAIQANTWTRFAMVRTTSTNEKTFFNVVTKTAVSASGVTLSVKDINIFDLTAMFGSTIADFVYGLEQSTPDAGVAWFKKLFPKAYYAYNAGTLLSVNASSHSMVGFNAYDHASGTARVVGGMQYEIVGPYTALSLGGVSITPDGSGKFTPSDSGALTVTGGSADATCVHLVWDGERDGEYRPYEKHTYALDGSLSLRGIPKLDANNNLYYDGDRYLPDGTVERRYGVVDLGTLNWTLNSSYTHNTFYSDYLRDNNLVYITTAQVATAMCSNYVQLIGNVNAAIVGNSAMDKAFCIASSGATGRIAFSDDSYSTAAAFKTAMDGVYLVYPLATPTTESADPYTATQSIDPYGTEEYVDYAESQGTRDVAIPVGHYTNYANICPITGLTGLSVYVSPTQDVADATTYAEDWTSQAGTVYGGTLDVETGLLTVDWEYIDMGSLNWTPNATNYMNFYSTGLQNVVKRPPGADTGHLYVVCSAYASIPPTASEDCYIYVHPSGQIRVKDTANASLTGAQFKTLMSGVQLVYELATPVTYQLTPQEVTAFTKNYIWSSSSGNVTVSYINENGELTTVSGANPYITDTKAVNIPRPTFIPNVSGLSIYRYAQGSDALHRVYDFTDSSTSILDYFVPSQQNVSYMVVAHTSGNDMIMRTSNFTPVYWFYSIILCSQDSNGVYHVRNEYAFKYGIETGQTSNNNSPGIQQNFTRYPTRQPTNSQYKTGSLKGYIGTVSNNMVYTDSVSLQDAIYQISTSNLTKFLKTRKGETIMVECSSPITMQTGDNFVQQPLVATINWVEVGDASDVSIVSIPTDGFWPL